MIKAPMKLHRILISISLIFVLAAHSVPPLLFAEETPAGAPAIFRELVVDDFEAEEPANRLGGASGTWNLDPDDPDSTVEASALEAAGVGGSHGLKIDYTLPEKGAMQNGYWTKLQLLNAGAYDHLQFDVRGDAEAGFTTSFKIELKKYKDAAREEKIKGTAIVNGIGPEWTTIQIPLNKMTGLLNFSDPEVWKDPSKGRQEIDELVIVLENRRVSAKKGTLYLDNIKFVNLGKTLPTAVDFPPRKGEKTPVKMEGADFAWFLSNRLQGFPKRLGIRKQFPRNNRLFLKQIARDTWRFFDHIVDGEHQLPLDTLQLGGQGPIADDTMIGDYTNVTNIGVYLMCVVSAYDLKFISKENAISRLSRTLDTLDKLEKHESGFLYNYYDTTTIERTSYFVSLVDSGWLDVGLYVVKQAFPEALGERVQKILASHSYQFFYDEVEQQMVHGFYANLNVPSDYHYGSFYTEPRAISYMAIARGDVPEEHWFRMMRTFPESYSWQSQMPLQRYPKTVRGVTFECGFYEWKGASFVPSWGGSSFEALMPAMVLDERRLAPEGLGLNDQHHVDIAIDYTLHDLKYPVWGMSPSSRPEGGYSEYGVKILGSKGYPGGVVTPHASVLALEFAPTSVIRNLRELISRYDIYGPYGFYDAVTVDSGLVAKKYLALDQGMILIALNNFLNHGAIRDRFHADPAMKRGEPLLREEKLFEIIHTERQATVQAAG